MRGGDDGGDDGGVDGDGGDGGDGGSIAPATTAAPPPNLTPDQVAQFYPNGPDGAPPVLGSSPDRLLLGSSLRGKGWHPSKPAAAKSRSILPTSAEGLE